MDADFLDNKKPASYGGGLYVYLFF